jgi:hypothetical protein
MGHSQLPSWIDHSTLPHMLCEHLLAMSSSRTVRTLTDESDGLAGAPRASFATVTT